MEPSRKVSHPTIFLIISINTTPFKSNLKSILEVIFAVKTTEIPDTKNTSMSNNTYFMYLVLYHLP